MASRSAARVMRDVRCGDDPAPARRPKVGLLSIPLFLAFLLTPLAGWAPATAAAPGHPSRSASLLAWPLNGTVISGFRGSEGHYGQGGHAGIDIAAAAGSSVSCAADGTVSFVGLTPLGPCVTVEHAGGLRTTYVALAGFSVRRGQILGRGQTLGTSDGARDRSSAAPHLHFGAALNGKAIDPRLLLEGNWDPSASLFLGPTGLGAGDAAYFISHSQGGGGLLSSLGDALGAVLDFGKRCAGAVLSVLAAPFKAAGKVMRPLISAAGRLLAPVGRAAVALGRGVAQVAHSAWDKFYAALHWVFSNKYVQALVAAVLACTLICAAVLGVALALGISLTTALVAMAAAAVGCIAFALYYAATSGNSFSFGRCFSGCLMVGGAAAGTALFGSYLAGFISSGLARVGIAGALKSFIINGVIDSTINACLSRLLTGRVSLLALVTGFILGGTIGTLGKLCGAGFAAAREVALAAGAAATETLRCGSVALTVYVTDGASFLIGFARWTSSLGSRAVTWLAEKCALVLTSGSVAVLGDCLMRAVTSKPFSLTEGLLAFASGAIMAEISLSFGGGGLPALIAKLTGGKLLIRGEVLQALVGKLAGRGVRQSLQWLRSRLGEGGQPAPP